jgi:RNA polymerase sigma-70 factor (sigma-E family)
VISIPVIDQPTSGTTLTDAYRTHYRSLVKLAGLLLDDRGACEEVVQDAFVSVFGKGRSLREPDRLPAYLRSAVLNGARSRLRKRDVRRRLAVVRDDAGAAAQPEAGALRADDRRVVLEAMRRLPERQREVLVLRYWLDLSEADIAETLGISAGTVKTHASRGMDALARLLEDYR